MNTSVSSTTGMQPYEVVFGQKPMPNDTMLESLARQGLLDEENIDTDLIEPPTSTASENDHAVASMSPQVSTMMSVSADQHTSTSSEIDQIILQMLFCMDSIHLRLTIPMNLPTKKYQKPYSRHYQPQKRDKKRSKMQLLDVTATLEKLLWKSLFNQPIANRSILTDRIEKCKRSMQLVTQSESG